MKKIGDSTNTATESGEWTEGNPAAGAAATLLKADWLNTIQREIIAVVLAAGLTLNKNDDSQLSKAISALIEAETDTKISSKPQFGIVGAIADIPLSTLGTYTSDTTDKPPSSGWGVFLRIKYPGEKIAFDIAGDVSGGMDILSFRRVLPNGSYVWRTVFHDGNFDPALKANLASPKFTGTPTAPTAPGDDYYGNQVANTAFVWAAVNTYATTVSNALATKAPLASPVFTGTPTAPTAPAGSNYGQVANTAFVWAAVNTYATTVSNALATKAPLESPAFTGTPTAPTAPAGSNYGEVANAAFVWAAVNAYATTVTNALASKATIVGTIPNRNPLPGGAIDIHGESFALVTSPHESCLAQNCYWNGADWVRHDPAQPAVCIAVGGGKAFVRTALPGAGPIVWVGSDTLWTAANATLTSSAGNATLRLPNGWIEQVFEVTESTGAADYRYFPVSFPNECFGVFPCLLSTTSGGYANNSGLVVGDVNKDRFLISAGGNFSPEGRMRVRALGR